MAPGSTIEVSKADVGGPNDGEREVNIEIIAPSKAKKRAAVGVGAKGGDSDDAPSGDGGGSLPDEPEVLPEVPDAPPTEDSADESK
jgi:hypothetical protein